MVAPSVTSGVTSGERGNRRAGGRIVVISRQAKVVPRGRLARGRFSVPAAIAEQIELRSPANPSDVVAVFPVGEDDVDEAVASAAGALAAWRALSVDARATALARVETALAPLEAELQVRMQRELGRPAWECQRELAGLIPRLRDVLDQAREVLAERRTHATVRVERRPIGVTAILGPVMFPLATSHAFVIAALVAGNTVVWKPSPLAAASAQLYAEALASAGLPPGVFNLVQGGAAVGERLVGHARTDGAVFVGSAENARALRRATADRLELKTMFHVGAKNAAVVLEDADVATTVASLLQGAFATAGQRCGAIGRVLVEASVIEPFLDELAGACRRLEVGTGPRAAFGPMFSRARVERFLERVAEAEASGARAIVPAEARRGSCFVGPSLHVIEDATRAARLGDQELFGPNLLVEPVADLDAAIARVRGGTYAALFSQSRRAWSAFTGGVDAGALLWNHSPHALSARVAFAVRGREASARGPGALLSLTREAAACDAPTGDALPFAGPRADATDDGADAADAGAPALAELGGLR
jgi:acyl-CoA reductase-like NAD-dependent aldehyde dehydrogenase